MAMARARREASQKPIWLWACFFVVLWCALAASSNWWLWCNPRKGVLNQVNKDNFCGHGKGQPRSKPSANLALGLLFVVYWCAFCCGHYYSAATITLQPPLVTAVQTSGGCRPVVAAATTTLQPLPLCSHYYSAATATLQPLLLCNQY